jgi:SAM-dependent methyltransferase
MERASRDRFSAIGHSTFAYCNPLPAAKTEAVLDQLRLRPGARVLELGCGKGELLAAMARRSAISGLGLERSAPMAEAAQARLAGTDVEVRCADATAAPLGEPWDVIACIGLPELFGAHHVTLATLAGAVPAGGCLLWGTTYWASPPPRHLLDLLQVSAEDYDDYAGVVARAKGLGLTTLCVRTASRDDWDHYQWTYQTNLHHHLTNAEEPDDESFRARWDLDGDGVVKPDEIALPAWLYPRVLGRR